MLPMPCLVLQPCDVIARLMTSSVTVLPSSLTSFKSPLPMAPYNTSVTTDQTAANYQTGTALDNPRFATVSGTDYRPANRVTCLTGQTTPPRDDVTGHLPPTSHGSRDRTSGFSRARRRDVTGSSGHVTDQEQEQGRRRPVYPLYCSVCRVRLNGAEQARQHFHGRGHVRRVKLTSSVSADCPSHSVSSSCIA